MSVDILVVSAADWGVEYTDADRESLETTVAQAIADAYQGATVRVETRGARA